MKAEQLRKFVGWYGFYVTLPLLVYPAAALVGGIIGEPLSWQDILIKGDLLFVVVVLLATTLDWMVIDFRLTPKTQSTQQWVDYVWFVVCILALVFYTLMYGWLITTRLPGVRPLHNPELLAYFSAISFVGWGLFCGTRYFFLLRQGRI